MRWLWEWTNNLAVGASILGVLLWIASWHGNRRMDKLIRETSAATQTLIIEGRDQTQALIERTTANTQAILERMDQRADERHRELRG